MTLKKLRQYENTKINDTLKYYAYRCLENMKTGMTLSIAIQDNEQISIVYYKN